MTSDEVRFFLILALKWAIPEKNQTGGWGYGISRGIEEIASGISRGDQEKIMWNFQGSLFVLGVKISEGRNTILWSF